MNLKSTGLSNLFRFRFSIWMTNVSRYKSWGRDICQRRRLFTASSRLASWWIVFDCNSYVMFVQSNSLNVVVVFDGYPEDVANLNIRYVERSRRTVWVKILVDKTMIPTVWQDKFQGSDANKKCLSGMLKIKFAAANKPRRWGYAANQYRTQYLIHFQFYNSC